LVSPQVVLPIEASLSPHDPLAKWGDHEACWQMQYRGSLGEALLHVLIICDTRLHTRLARTLLKCFPKLSLDVVEGEEYLGRCFISPTLHCIYCKSVIRNVCVNRLK
jgi:transient receptor potential cation channel subfamily V member 6